MLLSIDVVLSKQLLKKAPPHEQAAKVDAIIEIVGVTKVYNYSYWLKKVQKVPYSRVLEICKEALNLESKYNKGGFITNELHGKKRTT